MRDAVRNVLLISTTITGTLRSIVVQNNTNDSSTAGSLTDFNLDVIPTDNFGYDNNTGFTSTFTHHATTAELNDIADLINVVDKSQGKEVYDTTLDRPVFASGPLAADVWNFSSGSLSNTPV